MPLSAESTTTLVETAPDYVMNEKMLVPQPNLSLQVDFAWGKFRNVVSEKNGETLQPLYIQRFRPIKSKLTFESAVDGSEIATGAIHVFHINADCTIRGQDIKLTPLARLKTHYNYLSQAFAPYAGADPVTLSWSTETSLKIWDFICYNDDKKPIAKFSVNIWAAKQVGNFHFERPKDEVSDAVRDEIVITGLTLLYVMVTRMNNPLNLLGAAFTKTGKAEAQPQSIEMENRAEASGKEKDF